MPSITNTKLKGTIVLLFGLILITAGCSKQNSNSSIDPDTGKHNIVGWANADTHGAWAKKASTEVGFANCQECHGSDFSGGNSKKACSTCHGVSAPHPAVWRTGARTHQTTDETNASVCAGCHTNGANSPIALTPQAPAGTAPGCFNSTLCHGQGHPAGWAAADQHGASAKSQANGFSGCQSCHGIDFTGGTSTISCLNTAGCHGAGVLSPHAAAPWRSSVSSTMTHTTTNTGNATLCGYCHEGESFNGNHAYVTPTGPVSCFDNTLCHAVAATSCVVCHASPQGTRDAVVGEFGLAWGHKKSGRGIVTDADCIVCHLEGEFATQARSATYHGDGNIDLRDPDGSGEAAITNISNAGFIFTKFVTSYAAGSRTSTGHTSNNIDNVLTQKFCLACHDSDGATNTTARTTSGTAFMPFGGVNLGADYTVANGAAAAGGLVDVKTQFATTNSSKHPIMGPRNTDYPTAARLLDPYKPLGTRGTSGTVSQGVVMNCFDCHNAPTVLTTRTVAAHGSNATVNLRGVPATVGVPVATTNEATLCNVCHAGYKPGGIIQNHGVGSAWSGGGNNGHSAYVQFGCNICHSSNYATAVVRPVRAMDVHGVNVLPAGTKTTRWLGNSTGTPAQINAKPYGFIRNTGMLTNHNPRSITGSTYTVGCTGVNTGVCNNGMGTITVGGTY